MVSNEETGINLVSVLLLMLAKSTSLQSRICRDTVFSRLNAGGVYLKLGLVDLAFIRTRRLFGARRLFIKCTFQYSTFIEPGTKIQQKRLRHVKRSHQLCLIFS